MLYSQVEYLVNRIVSGVVKCKVRDVTFHNIDLLIKSPSRYHRYLGNELYEELVEDCMWSGMYNDDELLDFLLENNIWSTDRQTKLDSLTKDIEELKLRMYESAFNSQAIVTSKRVIKAAKADIAELIEQRYSYSHLSSTGFAEIEKNKFLIGMSLCYLDGTPFVNPETYWQMPAFILDQALSVYKKSRIDETQFRWLVRNEPWRSFWVSRKAEGTLFGVSPMDMTEDQRSAIIWSTIYDNVMEHPEQPPQHVIDDDDILDGWFIAQRKKREKELNQKNAEEVISNEKIKNSGEIFIPANTREDLQRIASLNDAQADITKRVRMAHLDKHGTVNEAAMPDTKAEIRRQRVEMFRNSVLGNKG